MTRHAWYIYEGDGGNMGAYEVWKCLECGACDSSVVNPEVTTPPDHADYVRPAPFYPNGSGLKLTLDCDESKKLIADAVRRGVRKDLAWPIQSVWST